VSDIAAAAILAGTVLLGSIADRVAQHARCPVMIVR